MDFFQYPTIPKMRSKSLKFKATVFPKCLWVKNGDWLASQPKDVVKGDDVFSALAQPDHQLGNKVVQCFLFFRGEHLCVLAHPPG